MGFSMPSTVPSSSAEKNSAADMGVGCTPKARQVAMYTSILGTRTFSPWMSSSDFTGASRVVRMRGLRSKKPRTCTPVASAVSWIHCRAMSLERKRRRWPWSRHR